MNERTCWNCGHPQTGHTVAGGCSTKIGGEKCDCSLYEDSEYMGEQRKRDTYRLSDMRRLNQRRQTR